MNCRQPDHCCISTTAVYNDSHCIKQQSQIMSKLTKRQSEILSFLKTWIEENGYPPTRAEIAKDLGFRSPNAAEDHLKALARKGAIEMIPGASRGIKIIETAPDDLP